MNPTRALKHIRQAEAAECGLACIAMIGNAWGHDLDLGAMRRRFGISSRGIGLRQLMQTADALGFAGRPLRVDLKGLAKVQLPAVLHWDMNHFVVVSKVDRDRAFILDPAQDARWHDAASLSKHFTGVALELRPTASFEAQSDRGELRLSQLWAGSLGLGRTIGQVALLSLLLQAYALGSPFLLQLAVDQALPAFDLNLLAVLALGFGLFTLINAGATYLRSLVLLSSGVAMSYGIASNVARRLMRLPITWFEKRSVGDILSRFQSVQPVQKLLTESAAASIIDGLLAVLTLALMLAYSPVLTLIPVASLALYAAVRAVTLPAERRTENERIAAAGREQGNMIETLRGVVTLRLAARETMRHAVWQNKLSESLGAAFAHERIRAVQAAASTLLTGLETVLIVWLGAGFAIEGQLSVGMLFAFLAYRLHFATTTKNLIDRGIDLQMLSLHLERLSDIALTREDQGFFEPETAPTPLQGEIELRGVTYAYGIHDPEVLTGVDLKIAPGEHVAITGPSGGGKTTLAKIILGLLDPTSGQVLVDGAPLPELGRRAFREQVAAVLQDDLLFAGTIADNVAGFDEIDAARLDEALQAAAVADDIARMPMKHLTLVGDMGSALSGGQRQRILLARALYRRPRLLVIDEGTAHLDLAHERIVNRNIAAMGVTRIVIAHRRETIEAADRVITLADGKADAGAPIGRRRAR